MTRLATVRSGLAGRASHPCHATQLRLAQGKIAPTAAAGIYDNLRYRWRGDATELDTVRALGSLYVDLGRYREALTALRSAGQRLPDLPQAAPSCRPISPRTSAACSLTAAPTAWNRFRRCRCSSISRNWSRLARRAT